jgi:hypothetical protein
MAIIGIDPGTSDSAVQHCSGRPVIIPRAEGISTGGKEGWCSKKMWKG